MKHTPLHALFLGALPSLANAIETVNVLVCLVQWANHANRTLISKEEIEQLWNGPGNDTLVVPGESISEYMASNSYGKYKVQAEVFDWFQVNDTEMDVAKEHNKFEDFVLPVLEAAIASGISLNPYANSEKELEGIVFVHSGYRAETGGTDCETGYMAVNRISTKSWNVEEPVETTFHNIQSTFTLKTFSVVSAYQGICGLKISGVGVWLHEWLHSRFGLEDLSDTAGQYQDSQISTGGIGAYGIMSYAGGQRHAEAYPGILSPYSKMKLSALTPIEIENDGTYIVRASALYPDVYKISEPYEEGEYLLIENRQPLLSDEYFWKPGGIIIYHVDENVQGYGNFYRGGPFVEGWPGNGAHYKVSVLQADGNYDLEKALSLGGVGDFWKSGDVLGQGNGEFVATSAGTYPNTDSYAKGNIVVTGLTIDNFAETEEGVWSFRVSGLDSAQPTSSPIVGPPSSGALSHNIQSVARTMSSILFVVAILW